MKYLFVILILALAVTAWWRWTDHTEVPATFASVEIAASDEARMQGLSGRAEIPDDYGILFVFPQKGNYAFWMKDMLVPIDIIWLDENYVILGIEHSVASETYPAAFEPPQPVQYVLETRAGLSAERGFATGTTLHIPR